ncbi:hypothetical protein QP150_18180 [Sphingomonas sp. 22L2VL55-3]
MTSPHAQPRDVFHEDGEVVIDGPDGAVIAMTPKRRCARLVGWMRQRSTN